MSASSIMMGADAAVSVASTPALPMAMSAFRHCSRVLVIGGASLIALAQSCHQLLVVETARGRWSCA